MLEVQPQSRAVQFYPTVTTNLPVLPAFGVIPPQVANTLKLYDLVPRAHGRLLILEKGGADTLTFSYQVIALDADGTPRYTSLPWCLTPLADGARFRAFVSTTDNVTQAVTVHIPQ